MKTKKILMSFAVVSFAAGVMCGTAYSQSADDFMAPPVVENVTELEFEDLGSEALEANDLSIAPAVEMPDVDFPDLETSQDSVSSPEAIVEQNFPEIPQQTDVVNNVDVDFDGVNVDVQVEDFEMPSDVNIEEPSLSDITDTAVDTASAEVEATPEVSSPEVSINIPAPTPIENPATPQVSQILSGAESNPVSADDSFSLEETYYSSDRGVTTSDLNTPQKADPLKDPAQRVILIDRLDSAGGIDSRFVAAQRALDLRRYASALEMFEGLYKENPRDQRILMGRAVSLQMTGNEDKAIQAYEDLLDLSPKNPKVLVNLLGLISKQYPAVALERLQKLYNKNPGNAAIAAQMGLAAAGMHDYQAAERFIGVASSIEPSNPQHYYNLAVIYDRSKAYKKAVKYYEKALQIDSIKRGGRIKREVIYDRLARIRSM